MAKRKESGIEVVASMPWPAGIVLGLIGYFAVRYGVGWYFGAMNNPYLSGLGKLAASGIYAPLGWALLIGCWFAAFASFFGRARRRRLLDAQSGANSLRDMNWREFEMLTGEAFRRQGYAIVENGLGGADGGIDLILRKDGKTILVQCKQWRNQRVDVKVVREMFGVLVHEGADAMKIVALGDYTPDAQRFAQGKPIELVDGGALLATVKSVQATKAQIVRHMDRPVAFVAAIAASLFVIFEISVNTATMQMNPVIQPAYVPPTAILAPSRLLPRMAPIQSAPQTNYSQVPKTPEELRAWKRKNAEAMKILDGTTREFQ
ncbi:MAG TPA: restriction endonuclease [Rhodanobacter sp.]|nr:restriction endonuclease [Rhodanobacter sp.]